MEIVPNKFPTISGFPYRIAIIGEAPGKDEIEQGVPFVGQSGRLLNQILSKANIIRDACFIGNVCQHKPEGNIIATFDWRGPEIQSGLAQLTLDLRQFAPNIVFCLGGSALHAMKCGAYVAPKTRKTPKGPVFVFPHPIGDWRGSLFLASDESPRPTTKCLASYHPAACLRQYSWTGPLFFDALKLARHSSEAELRLPRRALASQMAFGELLEALQRILKEKPTLSLDIEGGLGLMPCISVAESWDKSFIIPFSNLHRHRSASGKWVLGKFDGTEDPNYWTEEEEFALTRMLASILADKDIKKIWQNGLYDRFVLEYGYDFVVEGNEDDTMLLFWEKWCEFEKSLAFQNSVLGDEPYYKSDIKTSDRKVFFEYCCRDSACTFENRDKLLRMLDPQQLAHYRFNHDLLDPILYMEKRGIAYDVKLARKRYEEIQTHIYALQADLDEVAGFGAAGKTRDELLAPMRYKRDSTQVRKEFEGVYEVVETLLSSPQPLGKAESGKLSTLCNLHLNVDSAKQMRAFFYEKLALPKQFKARKKGSQEDEDDSGPLTTDYEALLKLLKVAKREAKFKHCIKPLELAIEIGTLSTRAQMLCIGADKDKRVRCGYNVVGSETGRLTCYSSPTGSGYNLQTIPAADSSKPVGHPLYNGMRDLFKADEGFNMFQCDLSGSDGWTVAAHLAALGDSTMLDDYKFGLKPAKNLCYLLRHGANSLQGKDRAEIQELTKEVRKEDWDYFLSKIGQHGSSYLMGPRKLANQVFTQSEGKVDITENEAADLQKLFFIRYRVALWHNWMRKVLDKKPELISASGHKRRFWGRPQEILGDALAHEPQSNTTYATNLAAWRLWNDPENRSGLKLRVEPLHQIHDAILCQAKIEDTGWVIRKLKDWFNNTLIVAGISLVIPFEGGYGKSWGELNNNIV